VPLAVPSHDGTVKIRKVLDILQGNMAKALGWLKCILGMTTTAGMSPNVMPERNGRDEKDGEDLDDPQILGQ
jgi:hypothetical protein